MRFQRSTPFKEWTNPETKEQILKIREDIKQLDKGITDIDDEIFGLMDKKHILRQKISHKQKYINQLINQLK
jgi:septal ring factor EnvC (AmiA/AmiB activator)